MSPTAVLHDTTITVHPTALANAPWLRHMNALRLAAEILGVPSPIEYGAHR